MRAVDCDRARKMCAIFEGSIPVVLYYSDEKKYDFQSGIRISADPSLLHGLRGLLGSDNVVMK